MLFTLASALLVAATPNLAGDDAARAGTLGAVPADTARTAVIRSGAPVLAIRPAAGAIRVDGELDDEGWEGAARVNGFTEFAPREGVEAPVRTEVMVAYDQSRLYVAFIAHDPEPGQIRASLRQRDRIWPDDVVGVLLDTYGDAASAILFLANPLGVQGDVLFTARGEDDTFDVLFESAGRVTDTGYQVEFAIPFSSLRFPDRAAQSWRINFYRNYPRTSRHQLTWIPISTGDGCFVCRSAVLEGIAGVRAGSRLELLPSIFASHAAEPRVPGDPGAGLGGGPFSGQASLGARYAFPSGWTAEVTVNPDYSQVESDPGQIDVNTTFALFYPERRPFFQEGSDLFDTWVNVVHTRSIDSPVFAAKLTGRVGQTSVGYLAARDERTPFTVPFEERTGLGQAGRSVSNLLRVRHNLPENSHVGVLFTDRRLDGGGSGTAFSADALVRFGRNYRLQGQLVGSHTREPDAPELTGHLGDLEFGRGDRRYTAAFDGESFAGHAGYLAFGRSGRAWSFDLSYREVSPAYRADLGFQSRNDFRSANAWTRVALYPVADGVDQVTAGFEAGSRWNFARDRNQLFVRPQLGTIVARQTHLSLAAYLGSERFRGIAFDGIRRYTANLNSNWSDGLRFWVGVGHGRAIARTLSTPVLGTGLDANAGVNIRASPRLEVVPSLAFSRLDDRQTGERLFSGYILRSRAEYQFNRELFARFVAQYNDFSGRVDLEPLLIYQPNPLTVFYIGSTHGYQDLDDPHGFTPTRRQYFAKVQYLFRL